jgi:hypothetical protein
MTSLIAGFSPLALADSPLDPYLWQNRILLIFAPSADDERLGATRNMVREHEPGFDERHLITGTVFTDGGILDGQPLKADQTGSLRTRYAVEPSEFFVFLIGKDGGVKLRLARPPMATELFELIDSMPMRRQEMRESPGG